MLLMRSVMLSLLMIAACTVNDAVGQWDGEYLYEGYGGETAGGSKIIIQLTLNIKKSGSDESCKLSMHGFQKDETIFCTTTGNDNKLEVKFETYDDGRILNGYDIERYKVGEVLFTLEKTEGKDKKIRHVPHWAAYVPFDDMDIGGKYVFKKK